MHIYENASLKKLNSFGFDVTAQFLIEPTTVDEIKESLEWARRNKHRVIVLGEGSNVVLTRSLDAVVIHPLNNEINLVKQDSEHYYVEVAAGVNWHQCVLHTLTQHYWGLENLALIPGLVGAAPIQNIGAYGVELASVVHSVSTIAIDTGEKHIFTNAECQFGYRDSAFKQKYKDAFVITDVTLRLYKKPQLMLEYAGVRAELEKMRLGATPQTICQAVCALRARKLPDPKLIGNAGSFFKNPIIYIDQFKILQSKYADIAYYDVAPDSKKIAAGWLIEQAGWKGKQIAHAGVHDKQALVLINIDGLSSGEEVMHLADQIKKSVIEKFGIELEQEPRTYK